MVVVALKVFKPVKTLSVDVEKPLEITDPDTMIGYVHVYVVPPPVNPSVDVGCGDHVPSARPTKT